MTWIYLQRYQVAYLGETFGWEATLLISAAVMMMAFTYLILSSVRVSPEAIVTE